MRFPGSAPGPAERAAAEELSAAQRALNKRREGYRAAQFNLAHACNVSTAHTTLPAPLAALALLNGQTHYESYKSQYIEYRLFTNALLPRSTATSIPAAFPINVAFLHRDDNASAAAGSSSAAAESSNAGAGPSSAGAGPSSAAGDAPLPSGTATPPHTVRVVTRLTDYLYRGVALAHLSPILLFMFYYKVRAGHMGAEARMTQDVTCYDTEQKKHGWGCGRGCGWGWGHGCDMTRHNLT